MDVVEVVVNSTYHKTPIEEWLHRENVTLQNIYKTIRVPEFELLKSLRTYIDKTAKCVQQVKFEETYDYEIINTVKHELYMRQSIQEWTK